jgi:hypothetical protein
MKHSTLWGWSTALSLVLIAALISLWVQMNQYHVPPTQLVNEQAANDYLKQNWESSMHVSTVTSETLRKINTGIFIQSLTLQVLAKYT